MGTISVNISGHVVKDPEVKLTHDGTKIVSFNFPVSRNKKNEQGEWVDATEWYSVRAKGYMADKAAKLTKGTIFSAVCTPVKREWVDKNGVIQKGLDLWVDKIDVLQRPKNESQYTNGASQAYEQRPEIVEAYDKHMQHKASGYHQEYDDDDIPF